MEEILDSRKRFPLSNCETHFVVRISRNYISALQSKKAVTSISVENEILSFLFISVRSKEDKRIKNSLLLSQQISTVSKFVTQVI